jgi:cytochrome c
VICLVVVFGGLSAAPSVSADPQTTPGVARPAAVPTAQPPPDTRFQKVTLNDRPGEPMDLAVLPDLRVLHTARTGEVRIHDPETGLNTLAATLDVYQHDEEGLQSVAIEPNFRFNKWVYLYYSPPLDTPVDDPATVGVNEGDAPFVGTRADWRRFEGVIRLSRFKLRLTDDSASHRRVLAVLTFLRAPRSTE